MAFSLIRFKTRRAAYRLLGVALFWGGLLLLLADMTTQFPTPLRGQFALWWLVVIGAGAWFWVASRRLPLEETIEIARDPKYFGELRVTELTVELNVSLTTAEKILGALVRKGYAEIQQRGETRVWVFPEIKAAGPLVRRSTSSRRK
ncbi:MAG: hypothetical protein J7M14_05250 [Planctomycetes bacterium]|nr:hypothetical protein [Planctomycetota bacterium]